MPPLTTPFCIWLMAHMLWFKIMNAWFLHDHANNWNENRVMTARLKQQSTSLLSTVQEKENAQNSILAQLLPCRWGKTGYLNIVAISAVSIRYNFVQKKKTPCCPVNQRVAERHTGEVLWSAQLSASELGGFQSLFYSHAHTQTHTHSLSLSLCVCVCSLHHLLSPPTDFQWTSPGKERFLPKRNRFPWLMIIPPLAVSKWNFTF